MIRYDLLIMFEFGAQSMFWYWPSVNHAVEWVWRRFPSATEVQVAWHTASGLQIQAWSPPAKSMPDEIEEGGEEMGRISRWEGLEIDP